MIKLLADSGWSYNATMSPQLAEILKQALSLSVEERTDLAGQLIESLDLPQSKDARATEQSNHPQYPYAKMDLSVTHREHP